jgi:hypothetical protein
LANQNRQKTLAYGNARFCTDAYAGKGSTARDPSLLLKELLRSPLRVGELGRWGPAAFFYRLRWGDFKAQNTKSGFGFYYQSIMTMEKTFD